MAGKAILFFTLTFLVGISIQACPPCECCKGGYNNCNLNNICTDGCIDGYFGEQCLENCLTNCKTCTNKYSCTECMPGNFTRYCDKPCGKGCLNSTCSLEYGSCTCKADGYTEGKCQFCLKGMYGDECNNTCPINCEICTSQIECSSCTDNQNYGPYCQNRCAPGCVNGKCAKEDGHCTAGCKLGYAGDMCDKCSQGYYGDNCDLKCPNNCSVCFSKSNCTECKEDFYGHTCMLPCPSGCKEKCSLTDGTCIQCQPNLSGHFCNDTCQNGTYGLNCSSQCVSEDKFCQKCVANESGIFVNCTQCSSGYYPVVLSTDKHSKCITCPVECKDNVCSKEGFCTSGCVKGKCGEKCSNDCKPNCVECNQSDGKCSTDNFHSTGTLVGSLFGAGLIGVAFGVIITLVLVVVWRRRVRKNKQTEAIGEHMLAPEEIINDENQRASPSTYEDLRTRDERMYSQLSSSQTITPQTATADYDFCA